MHYDARGNVMHIFNTTLHFHQRFDSVETQLTVFTALMMVKIGSLASIEDQVIIVLHLNFLEITLVLIRRFF